MKRIIKLIVLAPLAIVAVAMCLMVTFWVYNFMGVFGVLGVVLLNALIWFCMAAAKESDQRNERMLEHLIDSIGEQ